MPGATNKHISEAEYMRFIERLCNADSPEEAGAVVHARTDSELHDCRIALWKTLELRVSEGLDREVLVDGDRYMPFDPVVMKLVMAALSLIDAEFSFRVTRGLLSA